MMDNQQSRRALAIRVRAAMDMDERIRTQARLATRAGVGQASISRILAGRTGVTLETLSAVAHACGVQPYILIMPMPRRTRGTESKSVALPA